MPIPAPVQTAPVQSTIPQHVLERMENEWRQMRSSGETAPRQPVKPQE